MDKKYIVIAGAAIMVLVLVLQPFSRGRLFGNSPTGISIDTSKNITGTAVFNGTIRTYDPVLYMKPISNQSLINELRNLPGVLDVKSETNSMVVQTETRDDVFPIATWLNERNVTCYSIANIAVSNNMQVQTPTGTINATLYGGVVRVVTEPLVDSGEQVTVSMVAVVESNQIVDYSSASLQLQSEELTLDAEVESLNDIMTTYSIPWEDRNSIRNSINLSSFEDAEYNKVDSVVFSPPLTISQIIAKKQFSYITYIDANSAQVESSFDNITLLETNFQDTPFTLPPSKLVIVSDKEPELNYTPDSTYYRYNLKILDAPYDIKDTFVLKTKNKYEVGDTVQLKMNVTLLGNKTVSVKYVSLPS